MTTGPIEFLGERASEVLGHSEYGGAEGLIQPELDPLGGPGHSVSSSEVRGMIVRAVSEVDASTGLVNESGVPTDPATGRLVEPALHEDVTTSGGGTFSDMKP